MLFRLAIIVTLLTAMVQVTFGADLREPPPLPPELREVYLYFKQIKREANNHRVVTSSPNGSVRGKQGDTIYFDNSGTWKLCVNITTTGRGTTWRCSANALTAP